MLLSKRHYSSLIVECSYILFGSSKSALPGELEKDLAYLRKAFVYIRLLYHLVDREMNRAKCVGRSRIALRESRIFGAEGPLDFISIDEF